MAILATYNERRFIAACLENLNRQGVHVYLIDNESTDETVEIAERRLGCGVAGLESFPRGAGDTYNWRGLLRRKEELARELEADWFMHIDADEILCPPPGRKNLRTHIEEVDGAEFNAINFTEFTFVPTHEEPDHDHEDFQRTLRTYYPFAPMFPHRLSAWKATDKIELAHSGGHVVRFPGLKMYRESLPMKHYLFLSITHAIEKYVDRRYDPAEVESGWHGWRARITAADLMLPSEGDLRRTRSDADLDASCPRRHHFIDQSLSAVRAGSVIR